MLLLNLFNDRLKKWWAGESSPHHPRGFLSLARLFTWVALSVVTVVGMPLYAANVALNKTQMEAEAKLAAENGNSTELNLNDLRLVLGSASGRYYNLTEKVKCLKNNNPHNKYFIHGYTTDVPCDGEAKISGYWVWLQPHWYIWDKQVQSQPQEKP